MIIGRWAKGRTRGSILGMTFTRGSRSSQGHEWREGNRGEVSDSDLDNTMLSHAVYLFQEAIRNRRPLETLTQVTAQTPRTTPSQATDEAAALVATATVTPTPPGLAPVPYVGAAPHRCRTPQIPALGVKYGGDPKQLGVLLAQVWNYTQEYWAELGMEATQVIYAS